MKKIGVKRISIGKLCPDNPWMMIPNARYLELFGSQAMDHIENNPISASMFKLYDGVFTDAFVKVFIKDRAKNLDLSKPIYVPIPP